MRYLAVPVVMGRSAGGLGSLAVVAQPAAVAAPTVAGVPQTLYPDDAAAGTPLASSISALLTAYLTEQGDESALLSPGAHVPAPASALYGQVQVGQVAVGQPGIDASVPADGTACEIWGQITATDQNGSTWPLGYALRMRARASRWEVAPPCLPGVRGLLGPRHRRHGRRDDAAARPGSRRRTLARIQGNRRRIAGGSADAAQGRSRRAKPRANTALGRAVASGLLAGTAAGGLTMLVVGLSRGRGDLGDAIARMDAPRIDLLAPQQVEPVTDANAWTAGHCRG